MPEPKKRKISPSPRGLDRPDKQRRTEEDLESLKIRVEQFDATRNDFATFEDLPLSQPTSSGLKASHFKTLTEVQQRALPLGLRGFDILGAAKTGSGKTLAFLVPVLENLYRKKWTEYDGLGALILSPTRELAIQIFEVLRKIGRYHTFSAGLVIGGKSLQEERERLGRMNILVCTPGRMLQHMDQTAAFEIGNLQMLVLDEADRIMDMGFQSTIDAIVEHLPQQRQTLLFSATQTKKVSDLARLSLRDPEYVSVHEASNSATPSTLQQNYIVTPLAEKLDILWSFIRANLKSKILVFISSGKQVRFIYESFRHLQPGLPLLHLHGRQKQTARLDITTRFSTAKHSCLFATDVVARGLDFPAVDWVIQLDCPEDADTYIHRVGRTARYERDGRAVLFLEPSEEDGMLKRLAQKRVSLERINVRDKRQQSIRNQLQSLCFKNPELKYLGQKAFVSYVRSLHLQKDKEVFKLNDLPLEEYSASLGLPGAPQIKFMKGDQSKSLKNAPRRLMSDSEDRDESADDGKENAPKPVTRTKYDRMFERTNQDVLTDRYKKLIDDGKAVVSTDAELDNTDFLTVKRRIDPAADDQTLADDRPLSSSRIIRGLGKDPILIDSKRKEKLLKSKKKTLKLRDKGTKLVFDDEGRPHMIYELENEDQFRERGPADEQKQQFLHTEQEKLQYADLTDKQAAKMRIKEKKSQRKAREAAERLESEDTGGAVLVPFAGSEEDATAEEGDTEDVQKPQRKRAKKWFEEDSGSEGKRQHSHVADRQAPKSLEDLEAVALGMLG